MIGRFLYELALIWYFTSAVHSLWTARDSRSLPHNLHVGWGRVFLNIWSIAIYYHTEGGWGSWILKLMKPTWTRLEFWNYCETDLQSNKDHIDRATNLYHVHRSSWWNQTKSRGPTLIGFAFFVCCMHQYAARSKNIQFCTATKWVGLPFPLLRILTGRTKKSQLITWLFTINTWFLDKKSS